MRPVEGAAAWARSARASASAVRLIDVPQSPTNSVEVGTEGSIIQPWGREPLVWATPEPVNRSGPSSSPTDVPDNHTPPEPESVAREVEVIKEQHIADMRLVPPLSEIPLSNIVSN